MAIKTLSAICIVFLFFGCAEYATGPLFNEAPRPEKKMSTLYIYRVKSPLVYTPVIKINGIEFVEMPKLGYSYAYLSPGIYSVTIDYGHLETPFITEFVVEEGQEIYKRLYDSGGRKYLMDIPKEKAIDEIKDYKYVQPIKNVF